MKCADCGGKLKARRENYKYSESGLSSVTLASVEVRRCPRCGYDEVVIPKMAQLHRILAQAIARKPQRLTPEEIRFLRKYLGWSGADFARAFGVAPETVSRWETGAVTPNTIAEKLLRVLVLAGRRIEDYGFPAASEDQQPARYAASLKDRWRVAAA